MTTVAVTGIGGLIGRRLATELTTLPDVERVVGFDVRVPGDALPMGVDLLTLDVRDPGLADHLDGVDALVHLAFQFDPIRDLAEMHAINVDGTRNVFEAARKAGVSKVVYLSSAAVYGAHPDNDFPLTEKSPLRPNPDFPYVAHKVEVERWLEDFTGAGVPRVTILRPAIVAGSGVQNFISRMFEAPRATIVRGHQPPLQFVHVDDVVSAIVLAVEQDLAGIYNVAAEGWLSHDEVLAISGVRTTEVPEEVAFSLTERLNRLGLSEVPLGQLHYAMHPWVVSSDRLLRAGWRPRHSNRDALAELMAEHAGYVSFAGLRARRRDVKVVVGGVGALAGVLALRSLRRRGS